MYSDVQMLSSSFRSKAKDKTSLPESLTHIEEQRFIDGLHEDEVIEGLLKQRDPRSIQSSIVMPSLPDNPRQPKQES